MAVIFAVGTGLGMYTVTAKLNFWSHAQLHVHILTFLASGIVEGP